METRILIEPEIQDEIKLAEFKNSEVFFAEFANFDRRRYETMSGLDSDQRQRKPYWVSLQDWKYTQRCVEWFNVIKRRKVSWNA